ncbi:hypothetical protein DYB32_009508 [Aphanomyces invadans]|uniref:Uncharacterized protein n=1 Tax=Aphanomyces invadans TaxID=157072 RepID=A0A3R6V420_9STRA|nr:hypothetical protein DYB32_009508 [Aphanomyces invadans]
MSMPQTGEEAEDDDDYGSKEDKAFDILVNSLDDDNLAYVSHVTTSKAVWDLLVKIYEARTYADVSHTIHELHTKVYTPGSSMQKHITDLRSLQQKLLLMGSRVDDEMLGRILLTSVKEAFPTTVEILRSRELSTKSSTRKVDSNQLLYTGKTDNQGPYKKKQAVKNKCHYCNKIGYHAFESRYKKRNLAKGVKRKCMSTQDEDQINVLHHGHEEFILATTDDFTRLSLEDYGSWTALAQQMSRETRP